MHGLRSSEFSVEYRILGVPIGKYLNRSYSPASATHEYFKTFAEIGRDDVYESWLSSPELFSARFLLGRAGIGKTQLAHRIVSNVSRTLEWRATHLSCRAMPIDTIASVSSAVTVPTNTLIVFDDAEAAVSLLEAFFAALASTSFSSSSAKLRILVLGRQTGQWLDLLLNALNTNSNQAHVGEPEVIQPISAAETKTQLLRRAREFVRRRRPASDSPPANGIPDAAFAQGTLEEPGSLLMATAVEPIIGLSNALSTSPQDLALVIAGHSHLLTSGRDLSQEDTLLLAQAAMRGDATVAEWCRTVPGEVGESEGNSDLLSIDDERIPLRAAQTSWLWSMRLVQEAIIAHTLLPVGRESSPERVAHWLGLLEQCCNSGGEAAVSVFIHLCQDFGAVPRLRECITGSCAHVLRNCTLTPQQICDLEGALSARDVAGKTALVAVSRLAYERLLSAENDSVNWRAAFGRAALSLSLRSIESGDTHRGLEPAEQSVHAYRRLRQEGHDTCDHQFAMALDNLANQLSVSGEWVRAVDVASEAIHIYATLAKRSKTMLPFWANSLNRLANRLSDVGRNHEALEMSRAALEIYGQLVHSNSTTTPNPYHPYWAYTLTNLSIRLSAIGRTPEAVAASLQAIGLYRDSMRLNPRPFKPYLASTLANHATLLIDSERFDEAHESLEEAINLYEGLVIESRKLYLHNLAGCLSNVSIVYERHERKADALKASESAVSLFRELQEQQGHFLGDLAIALTTHANRLRDVADELQALRVAQEGIDCWSRLYATNPAGFGPNYARALNSIATLRSAVHDFSGALDATTQSIKILTSLGADNARLDQDLARTYHLLPRRMADAGLQTGIADAAEQSVSTSRRLATARANDAHLIYDALAEAAQVMLSIGSYEMASRYAAELIGSPVPPPTRHLSVAFFVQSRCCLARGAFEPAKELALQSLKLAQSVGDLVFVTQMQEHYESVCVDIN